MKKTFSTLIFSFLLLVFTQNSFAQEGVVNIHQDEKLEVLLQIKNRLIKNNKLIEGYTIQLYNGDISNANKVIKEYNTLFTDWDAIIEYQTPNYRVWVGNFSTRLEADRVLLKIQKDFPNAFVLRPDRRN
ncbi:MAG TPA: SPOR domain-containing protein [Flavobacteriaceae bacterium]|nr:SPOR domain-containing protein [Flavobacteriaceae bacterium]